MPDIFIDKNKDIKKIWKEHLEQCHYIINHSYQYTDLFFLPVAINGRSFVKIHQKGLNPPKKKISKKAT